MANREYFNSKNLDDALLKTYVTPAIVEESSNYIESLALTFNILPKDIANPTPYPISRLAQTFAYMTAAQRKSTFSVGKDANNDSFSLKYRLYKSLLNELESKITADSFKDGNSAKRRKFPSTMAMYRN